MELIRKKSDYALRCLTILGEAPGKQVVSVRSLAEQEDIPEDLLHKVMQALTRGKLVRATRGRIGGFRLAKPANKISVLDVLRVVQGPFAVSRCFLSNYRCARQDACWLRNKLQGIQGDLLAFFGDITIADLVDHAQTSPGQK